MKIPILNGIYVEGGDYRVSYPVNLSPVSKQVGINEGYLRPCDGIVSFGTGSGVDRGAIRWGDTCYRVSGTNLLSIASDGTITNKGNISGSGQVSLAYSFDRLAIAGGGSLFYLTSTGLYQVTDPDLGTCLDVAFVDGYFVTHDGEYIVVPDLSDPFAVNPLRYGSAEKDPDVIQRLLCPSGELVAVGRYTIETYQNIGGDLFPFERIDGALVKKGSVGRYSCCEVSINGSNGIALLGGGRDESIAVYFCGAGSFAKISTQDIDNLLTGYTESELENAVMESINHNNSTLVYLHLTDRTLVFDATASSKMEQPVWYVLTSALDGFATYRARNFVWCYDKWLCGDPTTSNHGYLSKSIHSHYGTHVRHEFSTTFLQSKRGGIVHELELVSITGRIDITATATIGTSYTLDGETWSNPRFISVGEAGQRAKRLVWHRQGMFKHYRAQKFFWTSTAKITPTLLDATLEALNG